MGNRRLPYRESVGDCPTRHLCHARNDLKDLQAPWVGQRLRNAGELLVIHANRTRLVTSDIDYTIYLHESILPVKRNRNPCGSVDILGGMYRCFKRYRLKLSPIGALRGAAGSTIPRIRGSSEGANHVTKVPTVGRSWVLILGQFTAATR